VLLRALIVAVVFYPLLVYVAGETSSGAALISAIAFLLMVPFGLVLDRMRYRVQMRRFAREHPGRSPS
jgi:predicted neutral ceramidase superfamily lipid hydrolase